MDPMDTFTLMLLVVLVGCGISNTVTGNRYVLLNVTSCGDLKLLMSCRGCAAAKGMCNSVEY